MTDITPTPRLTGARLVVGGTPNLQAMADIADTATTQLDMDLFAGSHPQTLERLAADRPGVNSLFLADPEVSQAIRGTAGKHGASIVNVGAFPAKNHAKSVVADGERGIVTTAALAPKTPERWEVGATFEGRSAGALSRLTRATASGDTAAIQVAAGEAQAAGILVNDPQHGVWHLSEELRGMVQRADRRIIVATKRLEEPGMLQLLTDAKGRGVDVQITPKKAGGMPLHANVLVADDVAYLGSGHLTKRVLTGNGSNGRVSRELGLVLDQPKLVEELVGALDAQGYLKKATSTIPTPPTPVVAAAEGAAVARSFPVGRMALIGGAALAAAGGIAFLATRGGGDDAPKPTTDSTDKPGAKR
ncbi:MAG: hypothetical protein JWM86_646 [Thermoleophilia bacterium]|nr:hypothetical protein [Thermoleophilia bacterium]